jgi:HK97 family phage prohead protease
MTVQTPYTRTFALEDISIRAGDGRTVDAYAAVFNTPTPIRDQDGEYDEIIDPAAFDRAIERARRTKGGWNVPVMFNHGMTIWSTPSERHSVPIGVLEELRAEPRGLFTRTRYHNSEPAREILEAIREQSITAYSFSGSFSRSTPALQLGAKYQSDRHTGKLPTVHRQESTLRELGPATFAAYPDAAIVGVRAEQAAMLLNTLSYDERQRLIEIFTRSGTPDDLPDDGTSDDSGLAADDLPLVHSARLPKEELELQSARFILRQQERQRQRAQSIVRQGENSA